MCMSACAMWHVQVQVQVHEHVHVHACACCVVVVVVVLLCDVSMVHAHVCSSTVRHVVMYSTQYHSSSTKKTVLPLLTMIYSVV